MAYAFIYDPSILPDPMPTANAINAGLPNGNIGGLAWFLTLAQVPARWSGRFTIPAAGYVILRQRWNGLDVLPGPVTAAQLLALPSETPPESAFGAHLDAITALLGDNPPSLSQLQTDVSNLRAYLGLASPTAAQSQAALAALIRVVRGVAFLAATT